MWFFYSFTLILKERKKKLIIIAQMQKGQKISDNYEEHIAFKIDASIVEIIDAIFAEGDQVKQTNKKREKRKKNTTHVQHMSAWWWSMYDS